MIQINKNQVLRDKSSRKQLKLAEEQLLFEQES